jgi:21S rRNA (GM2251-2'-O)-methyltransferase
MQTRKGKTPKLQGECLYGISPCSAAVHAERRRVFKVFMKDESNASDESISRRKSQSNIIQFCQHNEVPVHNVDRYTLDRMTGNRPHQGIAMDVEPLKFINLNSNQEKSLFEEYRASEHPLWLALDGVQDPMNLGAILRCAYYFGVERVMVAAKNSCSLTPTVSKASSGAMELMDVYSLRNLPKFLHVARKNGWAVLGTCSPSHEDDVYLGAPVMRCDEYKVTSPTVVVLGNEGRGLQDAVERVCTHMLAISSFQDQDSDFTIESLNVSVAAGIILHSLQASRKSTSSSTQ